MNVLDWVEIGQEKEAIFLWVNVGFYGVVVLCENV